MTTRSLRVLLIGALSAASMTAVFGQAPTEPQTRLVGPTFRADYAFTGSALTEWRPLGHANWRAQNGEIVGTPQSPAGGWLILDRAAQDLAVYVTMECTGGCRSGLLMRAEKTADGGLKGIFQSFADADLAAYSLTLDAQGREVRREKLNPPPPPTGRAGGGGGRGTPVPPLAPGVLPHLAARPAGAYNPAAWNEVEVFVTENSVRPKFNGGALGGNPQQLVIPEGEANGYGPIALYVGGSRDVRVRNLRFKDLLNRAAPAEQVSSNFRMRQLDGIYYSWSAAIADFNRDGMMDVAAGPFIYLGPDFTTVREIFTPVAYNPIAGYPLGSMVNLASDFTGDGWPDQLVMSGNAGNGTGTLYVNPKHESRAWPKYVVIQPVGNEDTLLKDVDGDGKPEVIHAGDNALRYSKPDPANPTGRWITRTISEPGLWGVNIGHGLGVGDVNGDGRMDYLTTYGWWEQPVDNSSQPTFWTHHPVAFGRWGNSQGGAGGAEIAVYDVNGDGLNDVVSTLEGHGFGVAWYEQKRNGNHLSFVEHMIMDNFLTKNAGGVIFSQPHASTFADMDGDGIQDFITGKRFMSHFGYTDPDPYGPAVLYVYKTRRNPKAAGGAEFVPELVHNRSGVGSRFAVADINGDGSNDIATSTNFGTFVFINNVRSRGRATAAR